MNWYIGQDIVCVKNHSDGVVKEGQTFTVMGIKIFECPKCAGVVINVGIAANNTPGCRVKCFPHNSIIFINDGKFWLNETLFKPLDELVNISELTEVLNEPVFK